MTTREDAIEKILRYLTFAETWSMWTDNGSELKISESQLRYIALPLDYFNGAIINGCDLVDTDDFGCQGVVFDANHESNRELRTMQMGDWDLALLGTPGEDAPQLKNATCLYRLARYRHMPMSEVRGRFALRTGDLVEWSYAHVYNNGVFRTNRAIFERRGDHWWLIGQPHALREPTADEGMTQSIFGAKSLAFTSHYDWHVEIGFEMPGKTMLPTIGIATSSEGAREAYRLRDIPPGKSRRDALRHWVSTHMRRNPRKPEQETTIWAHLRGVEEFSHNGLKCRIRPSDYDMKKAAEYQRLRIGDKKNARRKAS